MFVFIFYMFQANRLGGHNVTLVYVPDLFIEHGALPGQGVEEQQGGEGEQGPSPGILYKILIQRVLDICKEVL